MLQLPGPDIPGCLALTQLFREFASAAKGAITQFSNTLLMHAQVRKELKPPAQDENRLM